MPEANDDFALWEVELMTPESTLDWEQTGYGVRQDEYGTIFFDEE